MRRRIAATALLVAGSATVVAGCDADLRDTISSAVPTDGITLPTDVLPTDVLPTDVLPTDVLPTDVLPTDVLPTGGLTLPSVTIGAGGNPEQPSPQQTVTTTATATPTATDETDSAGDSGVTAWAWVLLGLVLVAFVALLVTSARRRRAGDDKTLVAQADGQIGWARSNTDDALVRWRADQLGLPAEQRDTDSELARRWVLLDKRVTSATDDLLTLESSSKDEDVRQAAGMLRQAAEGYRASVDALAQSVATGDQARISAASQALTADTTLLDQARQRLRQAAKL